MNRVLAVAAAVFFAACGRQMSVEIASTSLRVPMGGEAQLALSLHDAPGQVAQLTVEPAVAGVSVFPESLQTSTTLQNITFTATNAAVPGVNHVSLVVTAGGQKKSVTLDLEVIDADAFVVSMNPPALVVRQGQSATSAFTVKNAPMRSIAGNVSMTIEGLSPAGIELTAGSVSLSGDAAATGTLKATASSSAAIGMKSLDLVATQGSRRTKLTFQLVVIDAHAPDFALDVPVMAAVRKNGQALLTVRVSALMGFSDTVTVTAQALPAGITVDPVTATATASTPAQLTVRADQNAAPGMVQISIVGTSGNLVHQARVSLRVTESGTVDASFGTAGFAALPTFGAQSTMSKLAVLADGRIVAVGSDGTNAVAVRLSADGVLDTTFGRNGVATIDITGDGDSPMGIALGPNGSVLVALYAYEFSASFMYISAVAKLKEDGTLDSTFGNAGVWVDSQSAYPYAVTALADGSFAVAETLIDDTTQTMTAALTKVTAAGLTETAFGTGGTVTFVDLYAVDVTELADGSLVALMGKTTGQSGSDPQLTKLAANGQLDATFGTGGTLVLDVGTTSETGYGLALKQSGAIVALVLGYSDTQQFSDGRAAVFQVTQAGALDSAFGTGGKAEIRQLMGLSLKLQSDGAAVVGGCTLDSGGMAYLGRVARLQNDGQIDQGFSEAGADGVAVGPSTGSCVMALGIQSSGRIIAAGGQGQQLDEGWFMTRLMP